MKDISPIQKHTCVPLSGRSCGNNFCPKWHLEKIVDMSLLLSMSLKDFDLEKHPKRDLEQNSKESIDTQLKTLIFMYKQNQSVIYMEQAANLASKFNYTVHSACSYANQLDPIALFVGSIISFVSCASIIITYSTFRLLRKHPGPLVFFRRY